MYSCDIKLLQDNLDNLVNSLAKEYNYNNDNKDSENVVDKGKAKNYNDGSNNLTFGSNSNKAILGTALNNSKKLLIQAVFRR